jgi:hypothetical protein
MKKVIYVFLWIAVFVLPCYGQPLPGDIQQRLDSLKNRAKMALDNFRTHPGTGELYSGELRYRFSPSYLFHKSHEYNLNLGMIYDEGMRDRIVQLMRNEYREDELDTLVNRMLESLIKPNEREAMEICKFDTLTMFKKALDSLFLNLESRNVVDMMKKVNHIYEYELFKHLKLDTIKIFRQTYSKIREREKERERKYYLTYTYYDRTELARLCGYIGDKRFISPLIEALDKPDNFNQEVVIEALARMRVEPYYNGYVKSRMPRTLEQVNKERPGFDIEDFVYVIGTQEAFLELSKYLLSDVPYRIEIADNQESSYSTSFPISNDAFYLIQDHIENEDLQDMIKGKSPYTPGVFKQTYDWMQKNYGKYKIRRIW